MISKHQLAVKRIFDLLLCVVLIPLLLLPTVTLIILATIDTRAFGVFQQLRVGQFSKTFNIYKIRTLKIEVHELGNLNASASEFGKWLRKKKLDELPQLFNVLRGDMSFVGPRPDVPGFADQLDGKDRIILKIKPGITGPATLKYKNEDELLALQKDAETYNRTIIWPDKVKINVHYAQNWSFKKDLKYLLESIIN